MNKTKEERLQILREYIRSHKEFAQIIADCGITVEEKPSEMPSRPGYKWVPHQTVAGGSIVWTEEEDPNAQGTADNPIIFESGMSVYPNYYYTDGTTRYVCIQGGNPSEIIEGEYFTIF